MNRPAAGPALFCAALLFCGAALPSLALPDTTVLVVQGMGRSSGESRAHEGYRVLARRLERARRGGGDIKVERVPWETASLRVNCAERDLEFGDFQRGEGRPFAEKMVDVICHKLQRARLPRRGWNALRNREIRMLEAAADYFAGLYSYVSNERRREMQQVLLERMRAVPEGTRLVIVSHSLGSLMAYDVMREHPEIPVDLWVSFSQPAFDHHYLGGDVALENPEGLRLWLNVHDPKDVVSSPMRFENDGGPAWCDIILRERWIHGCPSGVPIRTEVFTGQIKNAAGPLRFNVEVEMRGELYLVHGRYWKDRPLARLIRELLTR